MLLVFFSNLMQHICKLHMNNILSEKLKYLYAFQSLSVFGMHVAWNPQVYAKFYSFYIESIRVSSEDMLQ